MLFTIISDKYLNRERNKGRAEGLIEGRAEGHAEERRQWMEWNERRITAEAAGEKFDEPPPPSLRSNGSG